MKTQPATIRVLRDPNEFWPVTIKVEFRTVRVEGKNWALESRFLDLDGVDLPAHYAGTVKFTAKNAVEAAKRGVEIMNESCTEISEWVEYHSGVARDAAYARCAR
jgi:hypothetical protein